jgi:predicted MFS family arabinose efflux permease
VDTAGWRSAYLALGVLAIVVPLPFALFWARENAAVGARAKARAPEAAGIEFRQALRSKSFALLMTAFTLLGLLTGAIPSHLVPLLVERHIPAMEAALYGTTLGFSLVGGRLVSGFLMDRMPARLLMVAIIAIAVTGLALMLAGVTGVGVVISIGMMGYAMGSDTDLLAYFVSRYVGLGAFTRIYGLVLAAFGVGTSIGPFLMGFSSNQTGSYHLALIVLTGVTALAAVPVLMLDPYPEEAAERLQTPERVAIAE